MWQYRIKKRECAGAADAGARVWRLRRSSGHLAPAIIGAGCRPCPRRCEVDTSRTRASLSALDASRWPAAELVVADLAPAVWRLQRAVLVGFDSSSPRRPARSSPAVRAVHSTKSVFAQSFHRPPQLFFPVRQPARRWRSARGVKLLLERFDVRLHQLPKLRDLGCQALRCDLILLLGRLGRPARGTARG